MTATVLLFLFVQVAGSANPAAQEPSAQASFRAGVAAQQRGELERAVTVDPQNASWHFLLGQAHQRLGNTTAVAREFAEAQRLKEQQVLRERKEK